MENKDKATKCDLWKWFQSTFNILHLIQNPYLKVSSISVILVSFSTTKKLGFRFLLSSPIPPSKNPVQVSSSPITAINFPRPAIVLRIHYLDEIFGYFLKLNDGSWMYHVFLSADKLWRSHQVWCDIIKTRLMSRECQQEVEENIEAPKW